MDLTTNELAEMAGVTPRYIRFEIKSGQLKAIKRARSWFIAEDAAREWLANPRRGSRSPEVKGGDADSKSGNL